MRFVSFARLFAAITLVELVPNVSATEDEVTYLPGYGKPHQRTLAGYLEVNRSTNGHLWYLFFEKQGAVHQDTPLLIWLNGGPGASSSLGNFLEHGPYRLQSDGSLRRFPSAWNTLAHVMYVDNPVGTGYSYCNDGGYTATLKQAAIELTAGILAFYKRHPEYKANPLHIAGESFAGAYIPVIADHILRHVPEVRIAGVLIGNPGNFHYLQYYDQIDFAVSHAMIGEAQASTARSMWEKCKKLMEIHREYDAFHACEAMSSYIFAEAGDPFLYNVEQWGDRYDDILAPVMAKYFSESKVKEALNAGTQDWKNGDGTAHPNPVVNQLNATLMQNVLPEVMTVLEFGVPLTVYIGVLDGSSCNHLSVFNALKPKLTTWSGQSEFFSAPRKRWKVPGSTHPAGYIQTGGGLRFVWVANSGHLVPTDQPESALEMVRQHLETATASGKTKVSSESGHLSNEGTVVRIVM